MSAGDTAESEFNATQLDLLQIVLQVLKHQGKASEYVREGVQRNKVIAELQAQITELNSEMDELKEENNANLSVINRLKDSLHEQAARLVSKWRKVEEQEQEEEEQKEQKEQEKEEVSGDCKVSI